MEHIICSKEREIGQISADLTRLIKVIEGNGQPGLNTTVPELTVKIDSLLENMESNKRDRMNGWQRAGIIITAILGFSSIVTVIIINI